MMGNLETGSADTVTEDFARDFVRRDFAAWNAHDLEAVLAMTTADVVMEGPAFPEGRIQGHEEYRAWLQWIWRAFPDWELQLTDERVLLSPDGTAAAWVWRGTGTMR